MSDADAKSDLTSSIRTGDPCDDGPGNAMLLVVILCVVSLPL